MSIAYAIREDLLQARKRQEKTDILLLTTFLSDVDKIGKDDGNRVTTDEETIRVIRKFIKNIDDTLAMASQKLTTEQLNKLLYEKMILSKFLPPELTQQQIEEAFVSVGPRGSLSMKSMGMVKQYIDGKWPGSYDGKKVSEQLKKWIDS